MKKVFAVLLLPVGLMLASCDPSTDYERYLYNQTDKDITVKFYHQDVYKYPDGPVIVPAYSTTKLFEDYTLGGVSEAINPMRSIDSVEVTIDSAVLTKDIMNQDNWSADIQPRGNTGFKKNYLHKYTFMVTRSDIE